MSASSALAACDPTLTVCSSGCDYDVLNDAVTDLETNCATPTEPLTIEITGEWTSADTTAVTISGISTTATNDLTIFTSGDARHDGVWSDIAYRLISSISSSGSGIITYSNGYVTIDGLQVQNTDTTGTFSAVTNSGANLSGLPVTIKNSIIRGARRSIKTDGVHNLYFINNIVYGNGKSGIFWGQTGTAYVYSNTIIGVDDAVNRQAGTLIATNNYASATTAFTGTITQTTNASSDSTAVGTGLDNIAYSTDNFTNVTGGSEDLNLVLGSALIGVGTDTSGGSDPLDFTTDITGTTRTDPWDIGAFKYDAVVPPSGSNYQLGGGTWGGLSTH